MARALPSTTARGDRVTAVRRALADAALGRFPAEERAWIDRIEANAQRIAAGLENSDAVRWMSLPPAWGRFLTRLVRELRPQSALELGTGFGVSTAYQAAALELNGAGSITSFDVPDMIAIAEPGLARIGLDGRAELIPGRIEETLDETLAAAAPIDYALIDHDHTEAGTLAAFEQLLPALAPGATVVFDDIRWTEEMRSAWRAIQDRDEVEASIGLRRLGVVVVGKGAK